MRLNARIHHQMDGLAFGQQGAIFVPNHLVAEVQQRIANIQQPGAQVIKSS